ncbi:hypothetical protein G3M48_008588 [Beauveria asiatica]|uniref:LysM domain-containing protein n=1 Tax=Beauveria asiatica TaxID=1069075 RepID=A0AAW0RKG8_9HYPO
MPTLDSNNQSAVNWPTCQKPTRVLALRTPTEKGGNGIETPLPTQVGMVDNCVKFCFVQTGDVCWKIAVEQDISLEDFLKWNPGVGRQCTTLLPNTYACVGVSK